MARFWEFAQLTDSLKGVSYFDHVPRTGRLYIGGLGAFYREPDPLQRAGITHVLSVLDFNVHDTRPLTGYRHLWIQVDDMPQEELLRHFAATNDFIDSALSGGGAVFVHCAMGVSRSATIVGAYLMWKLGVSARQALEQLREGRKQCRPNPGFARQLEVYATMLKAKDPAEADRLYRRWSKARDAVEEKSKL